MITCRFISKCGQAHDVIGVSTEEPLSTRERVEHDAEGRRVVNNLSPAGRGRASSRNKIAHIVAAIKASKSVDEAQLKLVVIWNSLIMFVYICIRSGPLVSIC